MSAPSSEYTIFIVDDHPIVRFGYHQLLDQERNLTVIGEAESGEKALTDVLELHPDLAILDIALKEMSGIDVARQLRAKMPQLKILVVSKYRGSIRAQKALEAGANGYLIKDKLTNHILEAVQQVLAGKTYLCNEIRQKLGSQSV